MIGNKKHYQLFYAIVFFLLLELSMMQIYLNMHVKACYLHSVFMQVQKFD